MELIKKEDFCPTFEYKLIYVFRINDEEHKNCLKVGDATIHTNKDYAELAPSCHDLNQAAKVRIDSYTSTAGIVYELLYTEIAVKKDNNKLRAFRDHKVHDVLKRSGVKPKFFDTNKKQNEWFVTDLETVKEAIKAVKENRSAIRPEKITEGNNPIVFRPEQLSAIKQTVARFKTHNRMLWNAKMRFGKTLCALQVAKEMNFKKIIIITHRPVVNEGWYEDFNKIFDKQSGYFYGSKSKGLDVEDLLCKERFVYFASMQDLRGSDIVGGTFDKNQKIFDTCWDFVVVDEAHEGTKTDLGTKVLTKIFGEDKNRATKMLQLSGTPFNIMPDYESDNIYTWDYIMEQEAKKNWTINHYGDSNPYEELPKMNIFTYHLERALPTYIDVMDKAFNFREFFRIENENKKNGYMPNDKPKFVHEQDVKSFLDLICKTSKHSNYPFSTETYRNYFRHSLWVVPGVKEAKALSELLRIHPIFSHFTIVNVAGDGDEEIDTKNALAAVKHAMTNNPDETYTITITCGRLTTGVSVPEWTAVLMLAGTYSTVASQYLQTIFRVQTPANINGKIKENCFVFDFAPDRTLKVIAESVQFSSRLGSSGVTSEIILGKFLNYCPIIAIDDSGMKEFKVSSLLQELKKAYAERVAANGFDDNHLYNDELLKLDDVELKEFEDLKKVIGTSNQTKKIDTIDINNEGFNEEEYEEYKRLRIKEKKLLTEEERKKLEELNERKKNKLTAISILRAISIRIPLMIYGVDVDLTEDVTIESFCDETLIDDASWNEFMPKRVDRNTFKKFIKYYDKDVFLAAGRRIRNLAKIADDFDPNERIKKIAAIFATFKNPDKETVLTPWRVVNMHLCDTIGGYSFFDADYTNIIEEPRYIEIENVTNSVFSETTKILEINSKTGLYPLFVAYTLYKKQCDKCNVDRLSFEQKLIIWDKIIEKNIFVICKTPMAKQITKRTLIGYRNTKINSHAFDDLSMQLKEKSNKFIEKVTKQVFWNIEKGGYMKFNAIIGNPPYQVMDGGAQASSSPVYNYFVNTAKRMEPDFISMIMPSRWMTGGKGLDEFRDQMIHDKNITILHDYANSAECFSNVDIKGGVCYFLWDKNKEEKCYIYRHTNGKIELSKRFLAEGKDNIFIREEKLVKIKSKVEKLGEKTVESIVSARKPYGLEAETMLHAKKFGLPDFSEEPCKGGYRILGLGEKQKRTWKYLPHDYPIPKRNEGLNKYKVFIAEAYGCGAIGEVPSTPVLSTPGELCTETFLQIGPFCCEKEAENFIKYIRTKFFRTLVSIQKQTQHTTQKAYRFVPMQNFMENSDIDWTKSISEIDQQLYSKYKLSNDEIEFIETKVAEMK